MIEEDEPFHAPFWGKHPVKGLVIYASVIIFGILMGDLHGFLTKFLKEVLFTGN